MKTNKFVTLWLPVIFYAVLIWLLSSQSRVTLPENLQFRFWDKCAHLLEYSVLGFLIYRAVKNYSPYFRFRIYSMLVAALYGGTDELHQSYVPGRQCDIFDLLFDSIGSGLGVWLYVLFQQHKKK